ncbi:MAG: hypothetical protein ALAOOOJD_03500 [bacterium]|nr:hypothetical protein [bacterium]
MNFRFDFPHAVPIQIRIVSAIHHLTVFLRTIGVGGEKVRMPVIVIGVQDETKCIIITQTAVPLQLLRHDLGRLGVVTIHPNIHIFAVIQDPHLGFLGCRLAFARLNLAEIRSGLRLLPVRFGQQAVQMNVGINFVGAKLWRDMIALGDERVEKWQVE